MATLYDLSPAKRAIVESTYDAAIPQEAIDLIAAEPEPETDRVIKLRAFLLMHQHMLDYYRDSAAKEQHRVGAVTRFTVRQIDYFERCVISLTDDLRALIIQQAAE